MLINFYFYQSAIIIYLIFFNNVSYAELDGKKDLVQPNEKHYDGIPKFIREPYSIYYVNKTQPAEMICIAEPVSHVNIFCAEKQFSYMGEEMSESGLHVIKLNHLDKPDPNGKKWKFSLVIKFKDVVEWFSEYKCYCEAWNQIIAINKAKKIHSNVALIQESYFQNKFKKSPQSQTLEVGNRLILSCVPPDAKPNAKISWLKNENLITQLNYPHMITNEYRQLSIERVQRSDRGNYTCVAQSLGMVKKSKPAIIIILTKFFWSEWTDWIPCPKSCIGENACNNNRCSDKVKKRVRFCLFENVKTNSENCKGESSEVEPCDIGCEHSEDKWKLWSKWTILCAPNCTQTRRRRCEIGTCKGLKIESRNCSQTLCLKQDRSIVLESQSTTMYLGLFVTISVLFIIILVILCLITQKGYISFLPQRAIRFSSHNNGLVKYYGNKSSKSQKLLINNEEKSTVVTIKNHNAQDMVVTNLLNDCLNAYSPVYEMHTHAGQNKIIPAIYSEYPISSKSSFSYPLQKGLNKDRSYNEEVRKSSITSIQKSRPSSALYQELSIGKGSCGILSNYLPANIDLDTVAWGTISSSGGRLCLPQSGISLTIPRGTIHHNNAEEIFLAVCRDHTSIPAVDASEMLLTPVILCGPPNLRLAKPIILTIPHCANIHSLDFNLRILSALYQNNQIPPLWKELSTIRPIVRSDVGIYAQLDPTSLHIVTHQPQMICLTGKSSHISESPLSIRLRILAFSQTINSEQNHVIRVHVIPDTKEASENVILSESELHGQLLDNCKKMSFLNSGDDITLCLEELSQGWRCQGKFQVIPHASIWRLNHAKSYEIHFLLEHIDPNKIGFTCDISVQQLNKPQNRVTINIIKEKTNIHRAMIPKSSESASNNSEFSQTYLDPLQTVFRLSMAARQQLWPLLDPYWQTLANHMNLNGNLKFFEEKISPTDTLFDLWEARCREESAMSDLINSLRAIGRNDCAMIVEQEMTK